MGDDALAQAMHIDNNVQPNGDQRWQALLSAAAAAMGSSGGSQHMQLLGNGTTMSANEPASQPLWQLAVAADCIAAEMGIASSNS